MQYLRPAKDAHDDALESLQYLQKKKKKHQRPSARDNNSFNRTFQNNFQDFLRLPLELRIEIYKLVFIGHGNYHEGYQIGRPVGRMPPKSRLRSPKSIRPFSEDVRENQCALEGTPTLAVAFTCRQVYLEAAPIYYNGIIWHFRSMHWLKRFLETLGPNNKIQVPHLTRLDIFNEVPGQQRVLLKVLRKTFPVLWPQMPLLETLNHGSQYNVDFPEVIWSRDDQDCGLNMTTQWYHFHTPLQLRLFGDAIGQEMRDSIKAIHVQLDDAAMADEVLRFQNVVILRILLNGRGALQVSTFHTLLDNLNSLRAGLPSLEDVEVQDPRDAATFLPFEEISNAVIDGTIWKQPKACDSSSEESSREPTPAAWASS